MSKERQGKINDKLLYDQGYAEDCLKNRAEIKILGFEQQGKLSKG
jgi:hypothetical protein